MYRDACTIIEQAQREAYRQVNEMLIKRNWLLGMRIQYDVLKDKRAEYGKQVVKNMSKSLMERYGNGFQPANIYHFIAFYNYHPDIFYAVSRKSGGSSAKWIGGVVQGKEFEFEERHIPVSVGLTFHGFDFVVDVTAAALGTIKFVFFRSYLNDYPAALVARASALLFPDPEGMIYEAGFHSVLFLAFTIRNASFFYCISPTHLSEEPKLFGHSGEKCYFCNRNDVSTNVN